MSYSTHLTLTVPLAGTWVYQNLFIEDTTISFKTPRAVVIHNTSGSPINYKLMSKDEDDGTGEGMYLENDGKILESDVNQYRIGVRFDTAQAGDAPVIVSIADFIKQSK